jgi:hypothetical protein
MKATIERATLLRGLSHVQSVVERRNTIPILSNVLIEAQAGGTMRLMATDLDLQIDETIAAAVDQPGAITVSAHTLFDIVRKLPEGSQVELTAAEGRITVNAGRAKFTLATLPRDDFPMIAEGELPTTFELPPRRSSRSSTRPDSRSRPKRRVIISTASSCTSPTMPSRCCAPPRPTATASPASPWRVPTAPTACPT